ncbi:hypothetical protein CBF45_04140 [Bordetella sp. J329]|nr:hypothetical protein CBF45_04140 [Bordetella sp. J329]
MRRNNMSTKIHLNLNESFFTIPDNVLNALARAISISERYHFEIVDQLRNKIANMHSVPVDWVSLYPGSNRALHYATSAFTSLDKSLIMGSPGFGICRSAAELHKAPIVPVPLLQNGEHDIEIMGKIRNSGLIYIANPNNPTGSVTKQSSLFDLLDKKNKETIILIDEAYIEFTNEQSMIPFVKNYENLVVTRTFSKIYGLAGLRLGYAIGNPRIISLMHTVPAQDISVPAAMAGIEILDMQEMILDRKHLMNLCRADMELWLQNRNIGYIKSLSNCIMIDCKTSSIKIIEALASQGVFVGKPWAEMPNYIRVTLGSDSEMKIFKHAFEEVMSFY